MPPRPPPTPNNDAGITHPSSHIHEDSGVPSSSAETISPQNASHASNVSLDPELTPLSVDEIVGGSIESSPESAPVKETPEAVRRRRRRNSQRDELLNKLNAEIQNIPKDSGVHE